MKLSTCVSVFNAICELQEEKLPKHLAHRLYMVKHSLIPHVEFYTQTELEIIDDCAQKDENGNKVEAQRGGFVLDKTKRREFQTRKKELDDEEFEFQKTPMKVIPDNIVGKHLEALFEIFDIPEEVFKDSE
jgi:hypothetical protein